METVIIFQYAPLRTRRPREQYQEKELNAWWQPMGSASIYSLSLSVKLPNNRLPQAASPGTCE